MEILRAAGIGGAIRAEHAAATLGQGPPSRRVTSWPGGSSCCTEVVVIQVLVIRLHQYKVKAQAKAWERLRHWRWLLRNSGWQPKQQNRGSV